MILFLYGNSNFQLNDFVKFVETESELFKFDGTFTEARRLRKTKKLLAFFEYTYSKDKKFKSINIKLIYYYLSLLDGIVLAAKIADKYFEFKKQSKNFTLADLYRVERIHYYDNSYNMLCTPKSLKQWDNH